MTPEKRKIQLTGGSTFIVSLPIKWVREIGLSAGDTVTLSPQPDRTLLISSEPKVEEQLYKATIELFQGDDPEDNFRCLVAHYLVGYDVIKLVSRKGFSASDRKFIKDAARQRLIGLEVIEESRNELILQSLLNYRDLSLDKAMQSMSRLVASMLEDVMRALRDHDLELANDVIQRDNEVDRFYLLTVRQLKAAIEDPQLSEKIGIKRPRECLGYRLATKSMERIGDHAERIAQNIIKLDHGIDEGDLIFKLGVHVRNVFTDAVRSLAENDAKHANRVIANAKKAVNAGVSLAKNNRKNTDPYISGTEMRSIIESLQRI
ncbi:MAG TPA: phosphate uptake regulator PhoU, partial [Methanosarcinales archaeon]|nr:phosphate uptake regulator PhoU [Methanosarcinales archaeon]